MSTVRLILAYFAALIVGIMCQGCAFTGQYCNSDNACCGGCCRNDTCIATYELCGIKPRLCEQHVCPPGLECYIYQPHCQGCDLATSCRRPKS